MTIKTYMKPVLCRIESTVKPTTHLMLSLKSKYLYILNHANLIQWSGTSPSEVNTRNIKISKATGERQSVQPLLQAPYPLTPSRMSASLMAQEPTAVLPPLFTQTEGPIIQNTKCIKIPTTLIYIKQVKVKVVYVKRSWYLGSIWKIWISVLQWCELTLMYSCSTAFKYYSARHWEQIVSLLRHDMAEQLINSI